MDQISTLFICPLMRIQAFVSRWQDLLVEFILLMLMDHGIPTYIMIHH